MKNTISKIAASALLLGGLFVSGCQAQTEQKPDAGATTSTTASAPAAAKVQNVAGDEAERLIAEGDMQVLDVRTPEEVAGGVIGKPTVINWHDADFATRAAAQLDKAKPVLVYCKAGGRSAQASDALVKQGFTAVYNLQGGITAWQADGRAIAK